MMKGPSINQIGTRKSTTESHRTARLAPSNANLRVSPPANASESITEVSKCPISALKETFVATTSPAQLIAGSRPPGPPGPPAFSLTSAIDVLDILRFGIQEAMLRFCRKYGNVCRFANPASLNGKSGWIFINDPDCIAHCAATNVKNYRARYLPDIYTWITHGRGILGSQGDYNAKHRRLCSPPFRSPALLKQFSTVITERALDLRSTLVESSTKRNKRGSALSVDIALHTQRLTLDIVGMTAFSHDFRQVYQSRQELIHTDSVPEQDKLLWAVNTFGEVLGNIFVTPRPVLQFLDSIGYDELKKLTQATEIMQDSMLDVIAGRRALLGRGERGPDDLLNTLLTTYDDDGTPLTDSELWEDIHDIMGAGHETTATTTAAVIYNVSVHQEVEKKLLDEINRVCGDNPPSYDDLENLVYLKQVVNETLRLYPAIPIFPREAEGNDVLPSGHSVDSGDVVFMSSYALGRSEDIWEDPLTFNPERFSPEAVQSHHRFQFLPFGAGPRMCLGPSWASMSVAMMAATLLQQLKFTAVTPSSKLIPVEYDITMNFNPSNGLHMNCELRTFGVDR